MGKRAVQIVFILAFLSLSFLVYTANQQAAKPVSTIDGIVSEIKANIIGDEAMKNNLPDHMEKFQSLRSENEKKHKTISRFVDYEKLALTAMPPKWQKQFWLISSNHKQQFIDLLRELIEEIVYPRSRDFFNKHELQYKKSVNRDQGEASDLFYVIPIKKQSGQVETIELMFRLRKWGTSWKIYDVRLEDQLWSDMFKNQFNHIITTKSYDALVEKMRQKLKNVRDGVSF